jgi:hypothetical protein
MAEALSWVFQAVAGMFPFIVLVEVEEFSFILFGSVPLVKTMMLF